MDDSNLKLVRNIPDDWCVAVYPVMKFESLAHIIDTYTGQVPLNVVFIVGINNRSDNFNNQTTLDIDEVKINMLKMFPGAQLYAVGLSTNGLCNDDNENMANINVKLQKMFKLNFVKQLNTLEVIMDEKDKKYKIHYTQGTVDKVFSSIINRLNEYALVL